MRQIVAIELRRIELELIERLESAHGVTDRRPILLLTLTTEGGLSGIGECVALLEPTYTEEYLDGAEAMLETRLIPMLFADSEKPESAAEAMSIIDGIRGNRMAKAALEMALLDLECREFEQSFAAALGGTRTTVKAGATVGITSLDKIHRQVDLAVQAGYARIKIKIFPGHDVDILQSVRSAFPSIDLQVDANGSYRVEFPEHLDALRALDRLGLVAIEQPCATDDLVSHGKLRTMIDTPVMLDESITSYDSLTNAIALHAMDAVSVKPARVGGCLLARDIHNRCVEEGIHLAIGGMFESGVSRAATLAVASLPGFDLPGDIGASSRYFARDITPASEIVNGTLTVPNGVGLGVSLLEDVVNDLTVRSTRFDR